MNIIRRNFASDIDKRISIEAGSTSCWYKYVGLNGKTIGINSFGESAPGGELLEYFGLLLKILLIMQK
jgi:transketolase